jgi:hypothetical protein
MAREERVEAAQMTATIRDWMTKVIQSRRDLDFDDLHVDEISPRFRARGAWINGAVEALQVALRLRNAAKAPFLVAAGFSLRAGSTPRGLPIDNLSQLGPELDHSPPSLYLFHNEHPPWATDAAFRELTSAFYPQVNAPIRSFFREWFDHHDAEFRRSFWLVG